MKHRKNHEKVRRRPAGITSNEINVLKLFVKSTLGTAIGEITVAAIGRVRVDFRSGTMTCQGRPTATSATELRLLQYLMTRSGEVVSREEIFRDVWGYENPPTSRSVDNYVLSLRKKIEPDPSSPRYLLTLRGAGYKLES